MAIQQHKTYLFITFTALLIICCTSCGINSDLMFKTPKKNSLGDNQKTAVPYKLYDKDSIPLHPVQDYRIADDDKFTISLSTNNGQVIFQSQSGTTDRGAQESNMTQTYRQTEYLVRRDGYSNLPLLGDVHIEGRTVKETEDFLKEQYSKYYIDPYIQVRVTNKRVIVFPGDGGDAKVIYLENNNTTLMEVIASAGGVAKRGKARSVKLIRMVNGTREIYPVDLSTLDGLKYADMVVQSNDYVYIEPNARVGREIIAETTPFLAILSSILLIFTVFKK